jgi:hypothetical protein
VADFCEHDNEHSRSGKVDEFLDSISSDWLVKTLLHSIKNQIIDPDWRGQILKDIIWESCTTNKQKKAK